LLADDEDEAALGDTFAAVVDVELEVAASATLEDPEVELYVKEEDTREEGVRVRVELRGDE
jgi:hypothetical protein